MYRPHVLELDLQSAEHELAAAEAALTRLRRRFDALLTPEALSSEGRTEQEALSRAVLAAELRAAAARRGVEVTRSALEIFAKAA